MQKQANARHKRPKNVIFTSNYCVTEFRDAPQLFVHNYEQFLMLTVTSLFCFKCNCDQNMLAPRGPAWPKQITVMSFFSIFTQLGGVSVHQSFTL